MNNIIQLESIVKTYRTTRILTYALNRLSLSVEEGEFVALTGPSGSGKTTLLNVIGLLDVADSGNYFFDGEDLASLTRRAAGSWRRANVSFVFQAFNLLPQLDVRKNIELPLVYRHVPRAERLARTDQVMALLDLTNRAAHLPAELSGGQQQRVAVARAVVSQPRVILADEPTGNLDTQAGDRVLRLLGDINHQGTTIVMVTHSDQGASFASRVIEMHDGQLAGNDVTV